MTSSNWQKPRAKGNSSITTHTGGSILISGNKKMQGDELHFSHTYEDIENICSHLPEELKNYTHECIAEHRHIVDFLLAKSMNQSNFVSETISLDLETKSVVIHWIYSRKLGMMFDMNSFQRLFLKILN